MKRDLRAKMLSLEQSKLHLYRGDISVLSKTLTTPVVIAVCTFVARRGPFVNKDNSKWQGGTVSLV